MKLTVSKMSKLSGVSVRTLHHYDEIGLLHPSEISDAGYRYYDNNTLEKLQQIMFYRELDFPLKEIVKILNSSNYKKNDALQKQKRLLQIKRVRLDKLILLLDDNLKGEKIMSFNEFDTAEYEKTKKQYIDEAKKLYGNTAAFTESVKKAKNRSKAEENEINRLFNDLIKKFSNLVGKTPQCGEVQELVAKYQQFICDNYYDCNKEMLLQLEQLYISDERFMKNIDRHGKGTTELLSKAIKYYCTNNNELKSK